jgi:alcohol dehydrogenase
MVGFTCLTDIILSDNLESTVLEVIKKEISKTIGIIADKNISSLSEVRDLFKALDKRFQLFMRILEISEPTTELVDDNAQYFRNKDIELFIGIGGGSTIDLTKAVSAMMVNPGLTSEYHSAGIPIEKAVKKIAVPTTAGTGSEVTPGAVLQDKSTMVKRALTGRCIAPEYAILNANLTLSLPEMVVASTGMDALAHAIESYTAKNANGISRMYSKEAFRLVFNNLNRVFEDKNNLELREKILLGSCLAGFAIFNSNTGACHSMAYPMGIYQHVPHGVAVGLMLDEVVRINLEKGCLMYADLLPLIDGNGMSGNPRDSATRFSEVLASYEATAHIGKSLGDYGVDLDNYEFLAERGLDLKTALDNNPVDFSLDDAKSVLKHLIE